MSEQDTTIFYYHPQGHDSLDGHSPETPKLTIGAIMKECAERGIENPTIIRYNQEKCRYEDITQWVSA